MKIANRSLRGHALHRHTQDAGRRAYEPLSTCLAMVASCIFEVPS